MRLFVGIIQDTESTTHAWSTAIDLIILRVSRASTLCLLDPSNDLSVLSKMACYTSCSKSAEFQCISKCFSSDLMSAFWIPNEKWHEPHFTNMRSAPTEVQRSTATRHTLTGHQLSDPPSFQKCPCHSYVRILELGQHQLTLSTKLTCCRNVSDGKYTISLCKHWTYNQECPSLVRNLITEQCTHFAKSKTITENLYRMCYHPNHRWASMLSFTCSKYTEHSPH
jgi:hypothetical protein